jgi:hypothetical protein
VGCVNGLGFKPVPSVHGSKDNLIDRLFINDLPLNGLGTLENLFDDGSVAGIGEGGQSGIYAEGVERCEYRVTVPFGCLFVAFGQGKQEARTSSVDMLTRSRLTNWTAKRERTNSQVLAVFFFELAR